MRYHLMSTAELRAVARRDGIEDYDKMSKEELRNKLKMLTYDGHRDIAWLREEVRERGISGYAEMSKAELIRQLNIERRSHYPISYIPDEISNFDTLIKISQGIIPRGVIMAQDRISDNYDEISFRELKAESYSRGINFHGKSIEELIEDLEIDDEGTQIWEKMKVGEYGESWRVFSLSNPYNVMSFRKLKAESYSRGINFHEKSREELIEDLKINDEGRRMEENGKFLSRDWKVYDDDDDNSIGSLFASDDDDNNSIGSLFASDDDE